MLAACTAQPGVDERFPVAEMSVGSTRLTVWVADQPSQRQQGLKGVAQLPDGVDGVLFVWDSPGTRSFSMADTLIPLDIWWFDAAGALIGSTVMEPCPDEVCPAHLSPDDVYRALETPAGERQFPLGALLSTG